MWLNSLSGKAVPVHLYDIRQEILQLNEKKIYSGCMKIRDSGCFSVSEKIHEIIANLSIPIERAEFVMIPFYYGCMVCDFADFSYGK